MISVTNVGRGSHRISGVSKRYVELCVHQYNWDTIAEVRSMWRAFTIVNGTPSCRCYYVV